MKRTRVVLAMALLCSFAISIRQQGFSTQPDYQVYYVAGMLVHLHLGPHLYDRPVPALDPVLRLTSPETPLARVAARRGNYPLVTYVYPPLLADLMVPISLLPDLPSTILWRIFNTGLVGLSAWLLGRYLAYEWRARTLLFLAMFFFTPVAESIGWGQIGIVLLACWASGILLYAQGNYQASALLLALATSIKLTPFMAIFPLLLWGEWRWLRWYVGGVVGLITFVLVCNGPVPLEAYFFHVLPAMAPGVASFENKSISSALQLVVLALGGHDLTHADLLLYDNASAPARLAGPAWVLLLARALCTATLAWVLWLVFRLGRSLTMARRVWILAAIAALSIALSPVSWRHSYCIALPLLVISWHDALRRPLSTIELTLLGLFSFEAGSFFFESIANRIAHGALLGVMAAAVPVLTAAWIVNQLLRMRRAVSFPIRAADATALARMATFRR